MDTAPVNTRAVVTSLAFDPAAQGQIRVTATVTTPDALRSLAGSIGGGGGGGSSGPQQSVVTAVARTVPAAVYGLSAQLERIPYFGQVTLVVVGHLGHAQLRDIIDSLVRFTALNRTAWIAYAGTCSAADILRVSTTQELTPARYLDEFFTRTAPLQLNLSQPSWLLWVGDRIPGYTSYMPVVERTPTGFHLDRIALVEDGRMLGELNRDETLGWATLRSRMKGYAVTSRLPGATVGVMAIWAHTRLSARWVDGRPVLSARTSLRGILGETADPSLARSQAGLSMMDAHVASLVLDLEERAMARCKALGADPFGFGARLAVADPPRFADLGDWHAAFARLPVHLEVHADIRSQGEVT